MVYLEALFHNKLCKQAIKKEGAAISPQNGALPSRLLKNSGAVFFLSMF